MEAEAGYPKRKLCSNCEREHLYFLADIDNKTCDKEKFLIDLFKKLDDDLEKQNKEIIKVLQSILKTCWKDKTIKSKIMDLINELE